MRLASLLLSPASDGTCTDPSCEQAADFYTGLTIGEQELTLAAACIEHTHSLVRNTVIDCHNSGHEIYMEFHEKS